MCPNHIEINSTLWYDNVDTCSRYDLKIWSNCHSNCSFPIFLCPISSNCPRMFSLLTFIIAVNMDHGQTTQSFFDHCYFFSRFVSTMTNPLELLMPMQPWNKGIDAREERNHWERRLMPWIQMNIVDVIAIRTTGFVLRAIVCVGRGGLRFRHWRSCGELWKYVCNMIHRVILYCFRVITSYPLSQVFHH
jgi:hypothetical protein